AAGPIGRGLTSACRVVIGNGALLLPLALIAAGAHMLRQAPEPGSRGRIVVGTGAITLSVLGLFDLWAGSPTSQHGHEHAGGALGAVVAQPLSHGLSAAIAVPLLLVLGAFGILVVTATPISALVTYLRELVTGRTRGTEVIEEAVEPAPRKRRRKLAAPEADANADT